MEQLKNKLAKFGWCRLLIILLCLASVVGLFLPYESSVNEHRKYLESNPDKYFFQEVDLKNKDVVEISIMENFRVYNYIMNNNDNISANANNKTWMHTEATIIFVLTIVLIASIFLMLITALFKKYILLIICDFILAISSLIMNFDIVSRAIIPSKTYTFGISYYLFITVAILIFILAIIAMVMKKKSKNKASKS